MGLKKHGRQTVSRKVQSDLSTAEQNSIDCCLWEWPYVALGSAVIVGLIGAETKVSKNLWWVNGEPSCHQLHVRRMRLERKLSSANIDTTGKICQAVERKLNEGQEGGGGQPEAPLHQDKGRKAVNNKLIRNGCKIAMDEKLDRVQGKKKTITEQWAVSLHPLCGDWQVTSSQSKSCT